MKKLIFLSSLFLAALPQLARAQWFAGARIGYAIASGSAAQGSAMSDGLKSQIPLEIEGGYTVLSKLKVGAYFSYGPGQVGSICEGASCSASVTRLGVEALWTFDRVLAFRPWAGAGAGYEWAQYKATSGSDTLKLTYGGLEILNLQAGADFAVSSNFAVGPFASFGFGRYSTLKVESPLGNSTGGVPTETTHTWISLGARGVWDF
jgi:hypothetical protein